MHDRRQSKRLPSILEGSIIFDGQPSRIKCTIRDLSATGARIWLQNQMRLPLEFTLTIPSLGQSLLAEPVWSDSRTSGLRFIGTLRHPAVLRSYSQSVVGFTSEAQVVEATGHSSRGRARASAPVRPQLSHDHRLDMFLAAEHSKLNLRKNDPSSWC
jgi:hypothetical protein